MAQNLDDQYAWSADDGYPQLIISDGPPPSLLGDRVNLRELSKMHLLWAQTYEVQAAFQAAMGGWWFNSQAVISLHYSAIHLFDVFLVGKVEKICTSHDAQDEAIASCLELAKAEANGERIGELYKQLRRASEAARYRMYRFSRGEFDLLRDCQFLPIKRVLGRLMIEAHLATRAELHRKPTLFAELLAGEERSRLYTGRLA